MTQRNIHGGHEFHFEGNLLIGRSWGSWNLEAITTYADAWKSEVLSRNLGYWGSCVDSRQWELATPDALDDIFTFTNWCYEHGCRFNGTVVDSVMADKMIVNEYEKHDSQLDYRTFTDYQACLIWCRFQAKKWQ
ncbi:hypothetical protein L4C34_05335 [Vibrio profundum]|uniref:hypothetical protein n=1 Tax=Vibrio profundum TaxID=2910247 RepID=UPI003D0DF154